MKTELLKIAKQLQNKEAFKPQLDTFKSIINAGDYLQAWQTILGNKPWLEYTNIKLPSDLEWLADNIGKTWHENGNIFTQVVYKNGKLNGPYKRWYSNGRIEIEAKYRDGKLHGCLKRWNKKGCLIAEINYKLGSLHGLCREWYENGQLRIETNYKYDMLHGHYRKWNKNGYLKEELHYENDKIVQSLNQ